MSMLTPPGMGGQYRIKGDRYPRMRRPRNRRRIVLASVGAVTALSLAGWGTVQLIDVFSGGGGTSVQAADKGGAKGCDAAAGDADDGAGKVAPADAASADGENASSSASASAEPLPEPGSITVNVLNATTRTGLAGRTAKELKKRGFTIGEVANAPAALDKKVEVPGLLMGATGADTVARLKVLGTQLEGTKTKYDNRKGEDVDLVIGKDFEALAKTKDAKKSMTALISPSPSPSASC